MKRGGGGGGGVETGSWQMMTTFSIVNVAEVPSGEISPGEIVAPRVPTFSRVLHPDSFIRLNLNSFDGPVKSKISPVVATVLNPLIKRPNG